MTVNLPWPYTPAPSPPRSREMAFYAPTQPNFLFQESAPITIVCQVLQRALDLTWTLSRNGITTPFQRGEGIPAFDGSFTIRLDPEVLTPGFYDLRVEAIFSAGESVSGITTFGWRAMEEPLVTVMPKEFASYWQETAIALRQAPFDLRVQTAFTLRGAEIDTYNREHADIPEHLDPEGEKYSEVIVSRVDFAAPGGGRVHGWFARPQAQGPFPCLLVLPGAGNRACPAPVEHARHGYAALGIQVHGFPVDAPEYLDLPEQAPEWFASPESYTHYAVYRNVLRAVDAMVLLPQVDGERLAAVGGSQGGRLSLVVAALDRRIKAAVPALAHFANCPSVRWVEKMNAQQDSSIAGFSRQDIPDDAQTDVESFFDTANFAPLVKCPILLNAGLLDPISAPSGIFAIYRRLGGPKEIKVMPNLAHDWSPAFERYAWRWLGDTLCYP